MNARPIRPRTVGGAMPARSVRVGDPIWNKARSRAGYEGHTISSVINLFLDGYAGGHLTLPKTSATYDPHESGAMPARSVRVGDETWNTARNRADYQGYTISHVINAFLEGYAQGTLDLPQVQITYSQPKDEVSA